MNMERDTDLMSHKTDRDQLFPSVDVGETLRDLMMRFRRHWAVLVVGVASAVVLALIMVSNASPTYTANGAILIDPRVGQSPDGDSDIAPGLLLSDALTVDSELRVLGSREVTAATDMFNALVISTSSQMAWEYVVRVQALYLPCTELQELGIGASAPSAPSELRIVQLLPQILPL